MKKMKLANLFLSILAGCFILIGSTNSLQAQTSYHLGIGAGLQSAKLNAERGEYNSIIGFHAGLINEFRFSDKFSIQADLFYSQKGGDRVISSKKFEDSIVGYADNKEFWNIKQEDFRITYVDAHILFKYNIYFGYDRIIPYDRPGKRVFLSVYGGPMIGYLTGFKRTAKADTTFIVKIAEDTIRQAELDLRNSIGKTKEDDFETFKSSRGYDPILKTDLGITLGAGLNFLVGERMTVNFDIRYTHGLGTIDNIAFSQKVAIDEDINSRTQLEQTQVNNRLIAFSTGVRWRVIGKGPNRNF
jgi:opacity protein-like surface antigen